MWRWLVVALLVVAAGCPSPQQSSLPERAEQDPPAASDEPPKVAFSLLPEELLADGWISLFDGQTLYGWQPYCQADWRVEDGAIRVSSGEKGLLCTTTEFDDYLLHLEFKADAKTNSGVFLRTPPKIGPRGVQRECYELNIAPPDNPFPTGSLVARQRAEGVSPSDDWQTFDVTVQGPRVVVQWNGKTVLQYEDPQPVGRGFIGLQHNEGPVAFRNIRLKPLGLEPIFNGKDLSGWRIDESGPCQATVTDEGWLNIRGGRGQLESTAQFADFILQLECITHAAGTNSGIFFRCVPGSPMDGYESQIHNGYRDGDRTRPVDCGTGGIFRRQDARYVAADDGRWFYKTIVAHGPHMAVWVNGLQVSDWTDTRQPHENPRRGLRTAAGTIMIQGHDPSSNVSFRNLRAREMAAR